MGAKVMICLLTGQDGNFHLTWVCVLGTGLAMILVSSSSVLVSVVSYAAGPQCSNNPQLMLFQMLFYSAFK